MKRTWLMILAAGLFAATTAISGEIPYGYHLTNHGKSFQDNDNVITYPISEAPRLIAIQRRARSEGATIDSSGEIHRWIYLAPLPNRIWVIRTDDGVLHYFRDEIDRMDQKTKVYQFRLPNGTWIDVSDSGVGSIGE